MPQINPTPIDDIVKNKWYTIINVVEEKQPDVIEHNGMVFLNTGKSNDYSHILGMPFKIIEIVFPFAIIIYPKKNENSRILDMRKFQLLKVTKNYVKAACPNFFVKTENITLNIIEEKEKERAAITEIVTTSF